MNFGDMTLGGFGFEQPAWLWLLPLALVPLLARRAGALPHSWLGMAPRDWPSDLMQAALRAAAVLALVALVGGMAGPYRAEYAVERVGRGAEIVLVLDRSRSMDQSFGGGRGGGAAPAPGNGPEALEYYNKLRAYETRASKGKVARELLAEFAAKRPQDRFGMLVFSTLPIHVLGFTNKSEAIQAAISAADVGRGLSETNIGLALQSALAFFEGRAYTGSRIVMLVSDGGDRIDVDARARITQLARKYRVSIYWIYIRSSFSPGLAPTQGDAPASADTVPEYFLHRFFESLGTPYRAYEADNPDALQRAIDDVNRLENLPITYLDTVPRRDLSPSGYALALACALILFTASLAEIRRWA